MSHHHRLRLARTVQRLPRPTEEARLPSEFSSLWLGHQSSADFSGRSMIRENSSWSRMEVEQEDSYFNGSDDDDDDLPGPQPLPPQPTAAPSSITIPGSGAAPPSLPSDSTRNPRKREATSSDDDHSSATSSTADSTASTSTSTSTTSTADRGKRLRLEKTKSQAELSAGDGGMTRSQTWPPSTGGSPLVDYGGEDSDEEEASASAPTPKAGDLPAGGFVREGEGDEPMRELKLPEKEEDGPPIPPKRRKDDDDDDGELGLLSKGASKKMHLLPSASSPSSTGVAGPKLGTFTFGGVGSKTVGGAGASAMGGAIKISLGIKSSLSKLAGGSSSDKEKKEEEKK